MFDLLLFSGCVFISFYVPYAKLNWAQRSMCASRLCSKLSEFDWGIQLTCGFRHLPQTGALTSEMPAEQAAKGVCYSSQMP